MLWWSHQNNQNNYNHQGRNNNQGGHNNAVKSKNGNVMGNNQGGDVKNHSTIVNTFYGTGGDERRDVIEHARALNTHNVMIVFVR